MAQFDLFHLHGSDGIFVAVQHDVLSPIASTVVIPLVSDPALGRSATRLNPAFRINGEELTLMTQTLAAVPNRTLTSAGGNLSAHRDEIVAALDFLFTGF